MKKIFIFTLVILTVLFSCKKQKNEELKASRISDFFAELKNYPDIYGFIYWNENWENENGKMTAMTINTSEASLEAFQKGIAEDLYLSKSQFTNGKLQAIPNKKYYGSFPEFVSEEDIVTKDKIIEYDELGEKPMAWVYFSNNWTNDITFPAQYVEIIKNLGKTPFIRLAPRTIFEQYKPDPKYTMQDIIDGVYDEELQQWASDAKNCETNLLIEFGTEINGAWFSWNGLYHGGGTTDNYGDNSYPDGPERFRDAYRHIIDIFNEEGADNITWFFHIDDLIEPNEWWNHPEYYYPGDQYIDWIGISAYSLMIPDDDYIEPEYLLEQADSLMRAVSTTKPFAILEFGVSEI